ncbi:MAG TPA: polysaccharide biosynthesis/export family protein [Terriglobales bacterium]|nr:polysaccharide biosynthesis/export family protein [Terriglobales bacterium]
MRSGIAALLLLLLQLATAAAAAQDSEAARVTPTGAADGNGTNFQWGPALTGERRPLYRLRKSDVLEVRFAFSPEFDQSATIQPDGFVVLRSAGPVFAEGRTLQELQEAIYQSYAPILRDPVITATLKDFEKPFFLVGGQVGRPGKYELRSPITASEAVAIAGGFTEQAKHSHVVLFRKVMAGVVESRVLNLKSMLSSRNMEEDPDLKPGDMLFVPQNRISKIKKFLPVASLSTFFNPGQF